MFRNSPKDRLFFAIVYGLLVFPLAAAELALNLVGAYYVPNHEGYGESGFAGPDYSALEGGTGQRDLGSSWGAAELKASFSFSERFPFLAGGGQLFSGNCIEGKALLELSPVSSNGIVRLSFTPIAFLALDAEAGIGTGWSFGPFKGLGINPADSGKEIELTNFGGAVWRVGGGATFQFDFAAVAPGTWNHVVFLASAKTEYRAFTAAAEGEAWLWEADDGQGFNGTKLYGTCVLAYQLPFALDLVGLMVESEEWLGSVRNYSTMGDGGWGSDYRQLQTSGLVNFTLGKDDSVSLLFQFERKPDWTDATTRIRYFGERVYEDSYWHFNRVAFSYTHVF